MQFYYVKNFTNKSKLTVNISKTFLNKLPIATIDFSDKSQKMYYDTLNDYVDRMLLLQKQVVTQQLNQKVQTMRMIRFTEEKINEIIYQLYQLTPEEIALIEGE
jgi:hypothetical protein